jgi:hypothetical protein
VIAPTLPNVSVPAVGISPPARPEPLTAAQASALKPADGFQECANCPEMVVVPAGVFTMGSPADEEGRLPGGRLYQGSLHVRAGDRWKSPASLAATLSPPLHCDLERAAIGVRMAE